MKCRSRRTGSKCVYAQEIEAHFLFPKSHPGEWEIVKEHLMPDDIRSIVHRFREDEMG